MYLICFLSSGMTVNPSTHQDLFHRGTQVNGRAGQGFGSQRADFGLERYFLSYCVASTAKTVC